MDYSTDPVDKVKLKDQIASQVSEQYQPQHFPSQTQLQDHHRVTVGTVQSHHHVLMHNTHGSRSPDQHFLGDGKHPFQQQYTSEMYSSASSHIADVSTTFSYGTHTTNSSMYQSFSHENSSKQQPEQQSFQARIDNQSPINVLNQPQVLSHQASTEHNEVYQYSPESLPSVSSVYSAKPLQQSLEHLHSSYRLNHDQPIIYPEDLAKTLACSTIEQPVSYSDPRSTMHTGSSETNALNYSVEETLHDVKVSQDSLMLQEQNVRPQKAVSDHVGSLLVPQQYSSEVVNSLKEVEDKTEQYSIHNHCRNTPHNKSNPLDKPKPSEPEKQLCPCIEELVNYGEKSSKNYICGGCFNRFITICHLHEHIKVHGVGGSYHFDHVSQTAYPKYDTFCSFTQTDDLFERPEETSVAGELSFSNKKNVKKTDSLEQNSEDNVTQKTVEESPSPVRKSRRRKQDNPKPSKIRVLEKKKNDRSKRARRRNETKKRKVNNYCSNEDNSDNDVEIDEHVSDDSGADANRNDNNEKLVEIFIENVEVDESDSKTNIAKPLKKRGRPRKMDSSAHRNVPVKRKAAKKAEKLMSTELSDGIASDHDTNNDDHETATSSASKIKKEESQTYDDEDAFFDTPEKTKKRKPRKNATKYEMCDICGLPVPTSNYQYHMRLHTGEKPFICEKCGKAFAHRRFLVKHMLTHAEEKPWKCNLCSAQFCQKSEYKMHMNGHEGVRPHECKVCGLKFLSKAMLNTHQANVHMGITRFECEVCSRRFFKRSSLNVHQATHYEATMKCNFCDRKFKDRAGLKRHERIHTGEKRFQCHVCNHGFIQSTPYWVHMEKRHQMDRDTVKNILADIREANKRSGIKTEINVLPADVDKLLLSKGKSNSANETVAKKPQGKSESSNVKVEYADDRMPAERTYQSITEVETQMSPEQTVPKYYTDIKVPNLYSNNGSELTISNVYSQGVEIEPPSNIDMQQQYRFLMSASDTNTPQAPAIVSSLTSNDPITSQSNVTPCNLQPSVSLSSLNATINPLHQHGFIGLNTLQQALDYSNSLPQAGTYTDISRESLNNQSQ